MGDKGSTVGVATVTDLDKTIIRKRVNPRCKPNRYRREWGDGSSDYEGVYGETDEKDEVSTMISRDTGGHHTCCCCCTGMTRISGMVEYELARSSSLSSWMREHCGQHWMVQ